MTASLLALAAAIMCWPLPRLGAVRLRRLVVASRLAPPSRGSRARWPDIPWRTVASLTVPVTGAAAWLWHGPVVAVAATVVAAIAADGFTRTARRRARLAGERDLAAAVGMLRSELEVGTRGSAALLAAAAVGGVHRPAFEAAARAELDGGDVRDALTTGGSAGVSDLQLIGQVWQLASASGTPLAGVLARVDDDLAARRGQVRAVSSALAGPRSSAALLAGLPVLGVLLGLAMGADPIGVLLGSSGGSWLLCAGVLLDAAGLAWTSRLATSAEQS